MLALSAGCSHMQPSRTCTYSPLADIPAGNRTAHVLAVDLNRDGLPDIVGTNQGGMSPGTISVALNQGQGRFAETVTYTMGEVGPYETTAADFNNDGYPDLAVELFGTADRTIIGEEVDVLINEGDGGFEPFVAYTTGKKPRAVTAADLDGDGYQDLIVADSNANTVSVMLGKGDGTFSPRMAFPAGHNPHGAVAADFDRNGSPDVAVCNNGPNGAVNVLLGNGDGTLRETVEYGVGAGAFGLDAGDLDGDGDPDIVTANNRAASVSVLINDGTGTFGAAVSYPATAQPIAVTMGDLQGDGTIDVLSASRKGTDLLVGNGDGSLQTSILLPTGDGTYGTAIADFDGDGIQDIAAAVTSGRVSVMRGACE